LRSDKNLNSSLVISSSWKKKLGDAMTDTNLGDSLGEMRQLKGDQKGQVASLSGHERNPLFFNREGEHFDNLSLISGADSDKDGRTVVLWDYNKDGFIDLAVVNSNAPKLAIYQNQLGKQLPDNHSVFIRFKGGNTSNSPTGGNTKLSNRDGYGCVVLATITGSTQRAEHYCGTGFAAQNSALMHLGIGKAEKIDSLTVLWPSGTVQKLENIPAGSLVTVIEGEKVLFSSYR